MTEDPISVAFGRSPAVESLHYRRAAAAECGYSLVAYIPYGLAETANSALLSMKLKEYCSSD